MSSHSRNLIKQPRFITKNKNVYIFTIFNLFHKLFHDYENRFLSTQKYCSNKIIWELCISWSFIVQLRKPSLLIDQRYLRLRFEALFVSYNRNNELIPVGQGCEKSFAAIDHLRSDGFKVSSDNEITIYFRNHVVAKKLS